MFQERAAPSPGIAKPEKLKVKLEPVSIIDVSGILTTPYLVDESI
jgi:hypothetical protein